MDEQLLTSLEGIEKRLSALLALAVIAGMGTDEEKREAKPETVLYRAGLDNTEIAKIMGKKLDAVRKAVQRAKK